MATVGGYLFELESFGLVERNSQFKFRLTSAGSRLAYIFIGYTKQVCLKELSGLINFKKVFKTSNHLKVLDVGCGGGSSLIAIDRLCKKSKNLIKCRKKWEKEVKYLIESGLVNPICNQIMWNSGKIKIQS